MTDDAKDAYSSLMARSKEMFVLGSANSILYWDMETKMPPAAQAMRGEQLSALELIVHKRMTDPENDILLRRCEAALDGFLRFADRPLFKFGEWCLVVLLAIHLTGGLRLLVIEFRPWSGLRKTGIGAVAGLGIVAALAFALALIG